MKTIITVLALHITIAATAQGSNINWQHIFGGQYNDGISDMMLDSRGDYVLCGSTLSVCNYTSPSLKGLADLWIMKLDASGSQKWSKTYGGTKDDAAIRMVELKNGGYIIIGFTKSDDSDVTVNKGDQDVWIVRLDDMGNLVWQKTYGGSKYELGYDIVETDDNSFLFVAQTTSSDGDISSLKGIGDAWVVKIDSLGNIIWQRTYGGSGSDYAYAIKKMPNDKYLILGRGATADGDIKKNNGLSDAWLYKINGTGNILWQKSYGGSGSDFPRYLGICKDGGYIIGVSSNSNDKDVAGNYGDNDAWVVKTDDTGKIIWQKNYGGSKNDDIFSIVESIEGGFMLFGQSESNDHDIKGYHMGQYGDVMAIKIDNAGNVQWSYDYGGKNGEIAYDAVQLNDSSYVFVGPTNSVDGDVVGLSGLADAWLVDISNHPPTSVIGMNANKYTVSVYPTVVVDKVHVIVPSNYNGVTLNLFNTQGQRMQIDVEHIGNNYVIDNKERIQGLYYLLVRSDHGIESFKIIY